MPSRSLLISGAQAVSRDQLAQLNKALKRRAEVAKARPGENAPQAIITCIEAAMRSSSYANGVMVEQRAKFQGLTAKVGPLDVADIVGTGLMGGGHLCSQRGAEVQVSKWWWVGHIRWHSWLWLAQVCTHVRNSGPTVVVERPGAAHSGVGILSLLSKLQDSKSVRYHGLWVWLETGTRGLVRFRS